MSLERQASEIISQYRRHGWELSRVLLSTRSRDELRGSGLFEGAEVKDSDFDAAWFTRSSAPGKITWELRALSGTPFALLEVFDASADIAAREPVLEETEARMRNSRARHSDS
jgi:hypothetical protein